MKPAVSTIKGSAESPAHDAQSVRAGSLLVVDDNELNRERLAGRLRGLGYTLATAQGGREALELLETSPFDLVLLDSLMPDLGGPETLREIKSRADLRDIPVIMISGLDEIETVARCIDQGAEDYLSSPFDPVLLATRIDACLENKRLREQEALFLDQLRKEKDHSEQLVTLVIPIGISLMQERDFNRLLEKILVGAKGISEADGGTFYLLNEKRELEFVMLRNDSLRIEMGGTSGKPIPFPPLKLYNPETGKPNHSQVACHVALTGQSVNIPDAYNAEGFDFHGTKEFDKKTGYRSRSFLTTPLMNEFGKVIGVLQLINAQNANSSDVIPFDPTLQKSIESLAKLAAAALESYEESPAET